MIHVFVGGPISIRDFHYGRESFPGLSNVLGTGIGGFADVTSVTRAESGSKF
jgi:hypothetical protein